MQTILYSEESILSRHFLNTFRVTISENDQKMEATNSPYICYLVTVTVSIIVQFFNIHRIKVLF